MKEGIHPNYREVLFVDLSRETVLPFSSFPVSQDSKI